MTKMPKPISVTRDIGGRPITIETGRIARQAHGAVTVLQGDTIVFVAVTTSDPRPGQSFFPLTVDYREVYAAAGKIPGGFFKREGRPTTKEILTCRLIDRPIRPLFPKGFMNEVLLQVRVFSADSDNDPDVLAMIGASAALSISKLPFEGPIGAVRIGQVEEGAFLTNPSYIERDNGALDLVVAGTRDAICMVEAGAKELTEDVMVDALLQGHKDCLEVIALIDELVAKIKPEKMEWEAPEDDEEALKVIAAAEKKIAEANFTPGKHERREAMRALRDETIEAYLSKSKIEDEDEQAEWTGRLKDAWEKTTKKVIRQSIIKDKKRPDSRGPKDIRPIQIEVGVLPRVHGSCLFTRGETQAVVSATLGTTSDEQRVEGLRDQYWERFMLHYNFPSYCVGETWPNRGPKRREIGHGALAERSIRAVLAGKIDFPYTLRIVSEITESNGSSSMATVCGGTLALMDGGVNLARPVAGIAMGLIQEGDDVVILSDILGTEDHVGDMDFKVAGTQRGITALQMDIKIKGLSKDILIEALNQAREGRFHILRVMLKALPAPRAALSPFAPRIVTMPIENEKIGTLIGPGGKTIRRIQEETNTKIDIDDAAGIVSIAGGPGSKMAECAEIVRDLTRDVEIGSVYNGTVVNVRDFGCFIEILPGKEGMLPVEEFAQKRGERITLSDHVSVGEQIVVKVIDVDSLGRIRLSKRAVREEELESAGV